MSDLVRQEQEIEGESGGSLSKILSEIQGERSHETTEIVAPKPLESRLPMRRSTRTSVGFEPLDLGPRGTGTTSVMLQYAMRPNRIFVTESVPGSTAIVSLFVGSANQMPTTPGTPPAGIMSSLFSEDQFGGGYRMDTIQPGLSVTVTVRNLTDQPVKFAMSLFGDALL